METSSLSTRTQKHHQKRDNKTEKLFIAGGHRTPKGFCNKNATRNTEGWKDIKIQCKREPKQTPQKWEIIPLKNLHPSRIF